MKKNKIFQTFACELGSYLCLENCPWIPGFLVTVAARVPKLSLDSRISRCRRRQGAKAMLCYLCSAMYAVLSAPYYLCCVSLLRGRCYAIFPMLSLLCFLCSAMLQSKLSRTAGPWPQHAPCPLRPRNRTLFTRTHITAAELYYLRHLRSCAAAADGNKASGTSHCVSLQMSACHDKARLLHSIGQQVGLALVLHSVRLLRMAFSPIRGTATQHHPFWRS